jgi:hypothetical protein
VANHVYQQFTLAGFSGSGPAQDSNVAHGFGCLTMALMEISPVGG